MKKLLSIALIIFIFHCHEVMAASTYYIDYSGGADTNSGTSTGSPWKHAPGMTGCSNNCLTKQNAGGDAGDQFILKGGVTWPYAVLPWDWHFGDGTSGSHIYFGVDQSWYSGGSWSRPVLDAEDTTIPDNFDHTFNNGMMRTYGSYFTIDNIEFKRLAQLNDTGTPQMLYIGTASELKNCYFHGWLHGGSSTNDNVIILGSELITEGPDMSLKIHDNVWDGSDTTEDMAMAYKGSAGHVYNNYVSHMRNAFVGSFLYVWGNTLIHLNDSFDAGSHGNAVENTGGQLVIYNNFIQDCTGGATVFHTPKDGYVDYHFNNLIIDDQNQAIQVDNNGLTTGVGAGIYIWNDTIETATSNSMISGPSRSGYPNLPFMTVRNVHLIGTTNTINFGTHTESNRLGQTNAQATAAGYVSGGIYPYYPPLGGATIDAGYDLTSFCSGVPSSSPSLASTACLGDATYGVSYNATNHTVSYPAKTAISRTTWDIGAYEYGASSGATLNGMTGIGMTFR
jgi:hypothetical protein